MVPSFGSFATSSLVNEQNPRGQLTTYQPVITGQDTDKEVSDDHTAASTQTSDDHDTKADVETNDDQKSGVADDHDTKADPETNDDG